MTASAIYFVIQYACISLFFGLSAYVFFRRDSRPIHRPFLIFLLVEALQFSAIALLKWERESALSSAIMVWTLRARFALGVFTLPLFVHMASLMLHGRARQWTLWCKRVAYLLAMAMAGTTLATDTFVQGDVLRGQLGGLTVGPVTGPFAFFIGGAWMALSVAAAGCMFRYAKSESLTPGLRADLGRLGAAWLLILSGQSLGILALTLDGHAAMPAFVLGLLQPLANVFAGFMLAKNILQYGSPASLPLHPSAETSVLLAAVVVLALDIPPLLEPSLLSRATMLFIPPLSGLAAGFLVSHLNTLRRASEWDRAPEEDPSGFVQQLRSSWDELAQGKISPATAERLRRSLEGLLQATYVVWLRAQTCPGRSTAIYEDRGRSVRLRIKREGLIEESFVPPAHSVLSVEGLHGPIEILLPVTVTQPMDALLLVGERAAGGVLGPLDLTCLRRFAHFMVIADKVRTRSIDTSRPMRRRPLAMESNAGLAIRTLGTLEVRGRSRSAFSLRSRQVLAHLLASCPEPLPAEELAARLWPELARRAAANNLYVTIHALRQALEPGLPHASDSHYILRTGDSYRFNADESTWVDSWAFERGYEWASGEADLSELSNLDQLIAILHVYRGGFLEEPDLDLPAETEALRYRLARMFLEMTETAFVAARKNSDWARAKNVILHALSVEPEVEDWNSQLANIDRYLGKRSRPLVTTRQGPSSAP